MAQPFTMTIPVFIFFLWWALPAHAQQPAVNSLSAAEAAEGWTLLFDGRTMSGWSRAGDADWRVEDGTLTATKGTGFLITPTTYGNFDLKVDFWASRTVNSGVFVRCGEGNPGPKTCYEVQINGPATGTLVNYAKLPDGMPDPTERWNTFEITADGGQVTVRMNGKTLADVRDTTHAVGTIALQEGGLGESGLVRFRSVKIRRR